MRHERGYIFAPALLALVLIVLLAAACQLLPDRPPGSGGGTPVVATVPPDILPTRTPTRRHGPPITPTLGATLGMEPTATRTRRPDARTPTATPRPAPAADVVELPFAGLSPDLHADSAGQLHATYRRGTGAGARVFYASSSDGGSSWPREELVLGSQGVDSKFNLPRSTVGADGVVHVVWAAGQRGSLLYQRRAPGGGWLAAPEVAVPRGEGERFSGPQVAVLGDGRVAVAAQLYADGANNASPVIGWMRDPVSGRWDLGAPITPMAPEWRDAELLAVGGCLHAIASAPGQAGIYRTWCGSWGPSERTAPPGGRGTVGLGDVGLLPGGQALRLFILYTSPGEARHLTVHAARRTGASSWTTEALTSQAANPWHEGHEYEIRPALATDDAGNVWAVHTQEPGLALVHVLEAGGGWRTVGLDLPLDSRAGDAPSVAAIAGTGFVLLQGPAGRLRLARIDASP